MSSLVSQITDGLGFKLAIGGAVAISSVYVIGIHVFGKKGMSRDEPVVIKSRMAGALIGTTCSVVLFKRILDYKSLDADFFKVLGVRTEGLVPALINSIGLTGTLFAGPILQYLIQPEPSNPYQEALQDSSSMLLPLRSYVIAPITEEIVYRSCLIPLLYKFCTSDAQAICTVPLFFGIAHAHHLFEKTVILNQDFRVSLLQTIVQMLYTTVFGALSTFIYLKTAHLSAVIAIHSMCNILGLPNFIGVMREPSTVKRCLLKIVYVAGIIGFGYGCTLIKPDDYENTIFY